MASNPFFDQHLDQQQQQFGRRKVSDVVEEDDDDADVHSQGQAGGYFRHAMAQRISANNGNNINDRSPAAGNEFTARQDSAGAGAVGAGPAGRQPAETIRVKLNESYFAKEKHLLIGLMANARNKVNSMRLFNPMQNETAKQQQQEWTERVSWPWSSDICMHGPGELGPANLAGSGAKRRTADAKRAPGY